ncbi:unnamed protein product [Parnassius apollo]|uniref:(apollo) hypothetical protein n=1 Tax=Parnassius apollo TaxID=110799 RepID=A0A8S3XM25_PARAO|nr:unnamed protein product [Parnassius apollo]
MVEYISIDEFDCGESSSTTEVQYSEAGNSASQASLENSNPATKSKLVQKRRAKNPPELQEASKQMGAAFNTLNSMLQTKKNTADKQTMTLICFVNFWQNSSRISLKTKEKR